ncbi:MAG: hypothetical protein GC178_13545 [Flavobacteriales bacterium]|nr:hypothetical protein [Flavobacteriales bacterium]
MEKKQVLIGLIVAGFFISVAGCGNEKRQPTAKEEAPFSLDSSIVNDSAIGFQFPKNFFKYGPPLNTQLKYVCVTDTSEYQLSFKLLESGELDYQYDEIQIDGRTQKSHRILNLVPNRGNVVNAQYGFSFRGIVFEKNFNDTLIRVTVGDSTQPYAHILSEYQPNTHSVSKGKSKHSLSVFIDSPVLWEEGRQEPYTQYLKQLVWNIGSVEDFIRKRKESDPTAYVQNQERAVLKYESCLNQLLQNASFTSSQDFRTDTEAVMLSRYWNSDKLVAKLENAGLSIVPFSTSPKKITIAAKDFLDLRAQVSRTESGKVLSRTFDTYTLAKPVRRENGVIWKQEFHVGYGDRRIIKFRNKRLSVLGSDGFHHTSYLISVWDKAGDSLSLNCLVNQLFWESIGTVGIDTVMNLSMDQRLILGYTSGGDGGDVWGSIWIALWSGDCDFRIVAWQFWEDYQFTEINNASLDEGEFTVSVRKIKSTYQDNHELIDTSYIAYKFGLDTIVHRNLTDEFNARMY